MSGRVRRDAAAPTWPSSCTADARANPGAYLRSKNVIKKSKSTRAAAILSTKNLATATGGNYSELQNVSLKGFCTQCSQVLSLNFNDIILPELNSYIVIGS
jgi:hypothetical protein